MSAIRNVNRGQIAADSIALAIVDARRLPLPLHLLPYPMGELAGRVQGKENGV